MESKAKKTDHRPLDPKLKDAGAPNRGGRRYASPNAAQDLSKKSDSEQPRGSGGT